MSILTDAVKAKTLELFASKFLGKAGSALKNKGRVFKLLSFGQQKLTAAGKQGAVESFKTAGRMLQMSITGKYKQLPWRSALSITAFTLYLVSPFDVIPDFIPMLGLLDDLFLLGWMLKLIQKDVTNFQQWERAQSQSVAVV